MQTRASERLAAWLSEHDQNREALARDIGVSREAIWRWAAGQRIPRITHLVEIERVTGIPIVEWAIAAKPQEGAA